MKKKRKVSDWFITLLREHPVLSAVLSSIAYAIYTINDTNVMVNHIAENTFLIKISTYLLIGSWGGLILQYVMFTLLGRFMDERYHGLKIRYAISKPVIIAGICGAIVTAILLYGYNEGKTIVTSFFSSLTVITLLIFDRRNTHKNGYIFPAILALAGSLMMVYLPGEKMSFDPIVIPLIVMLILSTIDKLRKTEPKSIEMGPCNFQFWRFLWLSIGATIIVIVSSVWLGFYDSLIQSIKFSVLNINNLTFILLTFVFVAISGVLDIGASQMINVSTVAVVTTLNGVFTFILTILGHFVSESTYEIPNTQAEWAYTILGAVLIALAVARATYIKGKNRVSG